MFWLVGELIGAVLAWIVIAVVGMVVLNVIDEIMGEPHRWLGGLSFGQVLWRGILVIVFVAMFFIFMPASPGESDSHRLVMSAIAAAVSIVLLFGLGALVNRWEPAVRRRSASKEPQAARRGRRKGDDAGV